MQGRALPHRHRLLRHPGRARRDGRRIHEQGAGRRRLPLLVPRHGGLVPDRAPGADRRLRDGDRPGRVPTAQLHQAGAVPVQVGHRVRVRLGRLREGARPRAREARLRGPPARAGGGARAGQADRDRRRVVHGGRRRRPRLRVPHRRPAHERRGRATHPSDRQGRPQARASSRRARATRRRSRRSSPRSSVSSRRTSRCRRATPTTRLTGSGRTRAARPRSPALRPRWSPAGSGGRPQKIAAHVLEASPDDLEWADGHFRVKGAPEKAKTIQDIAFAAYTNVPHGLECRSRGRLLLRPAQHDLPFGYVRGRRRGRSRHRRLEGAARGRRRRLRRPDQPDDRRGPDPRRAWRRASRSPRWS